MNLLIEKNNMKDFSQINNINFTKEFLKVNHVDYYYSNVIARASKTMFECRNSKINYKSTGTEG